MQMAEEMETLELLVTQEEDQLTIKHAMATKPLLEDPPTLGVIQAQLRKVVKRGFTINPAPHMVSISIYLLRT